MTQSYRDRDYAFGQAMLTLRVKIGMTQTALADYLGVSRRAVSDWEGGSRYPKSEHLKQFVVLAVEQNAFSVAVQAAQEIRALWQASRQKVLLDDGWLSALLSGGTITAPPSAAPPIAPTAAKLPFQPTPFVGREHELSEIGALLSDPNCRLLTLSGPGGIGKTRLAIAVAAAQSGKFRDGAVFVALAPLNAVLQISTAIGEALALPFAGTVDPRDQVLDYLQDRHLLLLLDNFEHVLDGAEIAADILACAPHVSILVTSRERLNLRAEWLYDVHGLTYPPETEPPMTHDAASRSPSDLADYSAVQLFIRRALQMQPRFPLTSATLSTIVRICQQVSGMPLAIELAAASVRTLAVTEIEGQIRSNLNALSTTLRDVPARHRSLRAVFDQSWEQLDEGQRGVFTKMAVFRGGCTLEAATVIAGAALPSLMALIDKSLLRQDSSARFMMIEPIREYALEKLMARGLLAEVQRDHAHYFKRLAEALPGQWGNPKEDAITRQLDREHDNLRAALRWCIDNRESSFGLELCVRLWRLWRRGSHISEGRWWLEELLALDSTVEPEISVNMMVRLNALEQAAWLASDQHDLTRAEQLFEQANDLRRHLGMSEDWSTPLVNAGLRARAEGQYQKAQALLEDALARHRMVQSAEAEAKSRAEMAQALYTLALVVRERGDYARAAGFYEEGMLLLRQIGDREGAAQGQLGLSDVARDQGQAAPAIYYGEQCLAVFTEFGTQWALGFTLINLALAHSFEGDLTAALRLVSDSVSLFRSINSDGGLVEGLIASGQILRASADRNAAYETLLEALRLARRIGLDLMTVSALEGLASLIVDQEATLAVQILNAAARSRAQMGTPLRPIDQPAVDRTLTAAHDLLGAELFASLWEQADQASFNDLVSNLPASLGGLPPNP